MRYLRYLRYLIILTSLTIPMSAFGGKAQVHEAASKDLQFFLNSIPAGHEHLYGFNSREDFSGATPGEPIPMLTLDHNDDYSVVEINEWRVPVVLNGKTLAFLTVSRVDDQWLAVEIGASGLAEEVSRIQNVEAILRLYSLKCDFVMLSRDKYMPLQSASSHLKKHISPLSQYYTLHDIVDMVKRSEK